MKKEEKEIYEKVIEEIRLKKAEIRKFKRGRGGKTGGRREESGRRRYLPRRWLVCHCAFPARYRRHGRAAVPAC